MEGRLAAFVESGAVVLILVNSFEFLEIKSVEDVVAPLRSVCA